MNFAVLAPWTVLWVDFDPQVGHDQAHRRPAIVVGSHWAAQVGQRNGLVIVVPCTGTDRNLPWQPRVDLGGRVGVAMCDQVRAVSVKRVKGIHPATLDPDRIAMVQHALRSMLAL